MTPAEAILAHEAGQLSAVAMVRQIIGHDQWQIPVSESAVGDMLSGGESRVQISTTPEGVSRLLIFSSSDTYSVYRDARPDDPSDQHFLTTTGCWIFGQALDGIDAVIIDPLNKHAIEYSSANFNYLKRIASAIGIERELIEIRTNPSAPDYLFERVRAYPDFRIAIFRDETGTHLGMAPDSKDRVLAAIFTFDDNEDAYLAEAATIYPGKVMERLILDGGSLCRQLLQTNALGLVFNPCGPVAPVAFVIQFAHFVSQAG